MKAVNSEGQASSTPSEIDFIVLPPFWRHWWFESLALAALASVIYSMHRYRMSQILKTCPLQVLRHQQWKNSAHKRRVKAWNVSGPPMHLRS